jgi:hypothetical protein
MKHTTTRMLFSYWDTLRGERTVPERSEIVPGDIRHILADTFILETGSDNSGIFRLAGTRVCALFRRELKSHLFQTLWADSKPQNGQKLLDIVMEETAGIVAGLTAETHEGRSLDLELLLLPLSHRGERRARMIGALSPAAIPEWLGLDYITKVKTVSLRVIWPSHHQVELENHGEAARDRRRRFVVYNGGRA